MEEKRIKKLRPIIFYIFLFLFILAFGTIAKDYDYDFWARLIAGMGFVQTGHVLKQDFLSYTPTHTWFDHEWGSGVIFYLTQHFFSASGILILQAVLVFLMFFTITKVIKLRGGKTTDAYNFLFYYFAYIILSYILNSPIRCQIFSFLFFTAFLYLMERERKGVNKGWELIILPPLLMIIWNNLHGGCVSGIGLIVIYIIGEFLNRKPVRKYIYALIGAIVVLPVNPWGFSYLEFLFKANTMQRTDIVEWWGLFSGFFMFKYIKFKLYALILFSLELGLIIKQIKDKTFNFDKTKFLVLGVTLFLAIQHVKLIPFAVISMMCFLYDDFYTVFNGITKNFFNKIAVFKDTIIYLIILFFVVFNLKVEAFQPLISKSRYPIFAVEFVRANDIKGNLLISFGLGSYASYKLYPNNKIFMDGRYEEVYYDDLVPMMNKFYTLKPGWDELLKKYPPDVMIIEKFYSIFYALVKNKDWDYVYDDNYFGVFVKHQDRKKIYKKPETNQEYYKKTLFDTKIKFF
ncbi:MAG: hypothetical protein PHC64_02970 [Candidatus Gastranaerophilales bacterium]|nr:hypothetical protein [Candidatus Gastranaerophilales bacterium]